MFSGGVAKSCQPEASRLALGPGSMMLTSRLPSSVASKTFTVGFGTSCWLCFEASRRHVSGHSPVVAASAAILDGRYFYFSQVLVFLGVESGRNTAAFRI